MGGRGEALCVSYATQNIHKVIHTLYHAIRSSIDGMESLPSVVDNSLWLEISDSAKYRISTGAWAIILHTCEPTHLADSPMIASIHRRGNPVQRQHKEPVSLKCIY